ncbi:Unconventional myosin-Va [Bagarius yarrelli]|uniref:Unconventional myosin-Va n=1 Tax=Bagarius yarrelli TaxID=175774 RepID=A0A556TI01_BAGYA|nr:Unconventional myosin-Va [Bagarius yarrelli]
MSSETEQPVEEVTTEEQQQKYFDSGDYNMAKAKIKNKQLPAATAEKTEITGDHIPTPQDLPQRKTSLFTRVWIPDSQEVWRAAELTKDYEPGDTALELQIQDGTANEERNYHIFYQLCASAHLPEFTDLQLVSAAQFHCTNQGKSPVIDRVDDVQEMQVTRRAFSLLGISESQQLELFQILAAILHLGNVEMTGKGSGNCSVSFAFLLELFQEEEKAPSKVASSRTKMTQGSQSFREHKKSVGLQVDVSGVLQSLPGSYEAKGCAIRPKVNLPECSTTGDTEGLEFNKYLPTDNTDNSSLIIVPSLCKSLRKTRAALVIQKYQRRYAARRLFKQKRAAAVLLQQLLRGHAARLQYRQLRYEQKVVVVQRWVRGWLARLHYTHTVQAVVYLQCCVRRMLAQRELKRLKIEARSVEHYKKLNVGMEKKIMQLQRKVDEQMLAELKETNCLLKSEKDDLNRLIQEQSQQIADQLLETHKEYTEHLKMELNDERSRYQNLLTEHAKLEALYTDLKSKQEAATHATKFGHLRKDSAFSSNESENTYCSEFTASEVSLQFPEDEVKGSMDVALLLKLQKRVAQLEQEKMNLQREWDSREEQLQQQHHKTLDECRRTLGAERDYEAQKRQELESANKRLKKDLNELRTSLSAGKGSKLATAYNLLLEQLNSTTEELEIRKEEVLMLRSQLVNLDGFKFKDSAVEINSNDSSRVLESQLQTERHGHTEELEALRAELQVLKAEREQNLLPDMLQLSQDGRVNVALQNEITRLTRHNLDLMDQMDKQDKTTRKLKKQLKIYMRKLEESDNAENEIGDVLPEVNILRKEQRCQGMLQYRKEDEAKLFRTLITVAAMLEQDTIPGVLGLKPTGLRKRTSSSFTLESILKQLDSFHSTLLQHGNDTELIRQLEEWLMDRGVQGGGVRETLEPLIQAAQLLQIKKKNQEDAEAITMMCTALTGTQALLKDRQESHHLLMDTKILFPLSLAFNPSTVALESLQIPQSLNLGFLTRL